MATPASRREGDRMDLLATIAETYQQNERDRRLMRAADARIARRTRWQAALVSRATGATLVTLAHRGEERLPYVTDRALR